MTGQAPSGFTSTKANNLSLAVDVFYAWVDYLGTCNAYLASFGAWFHEPLPQPRPRSRELDAREGKQEGLD